MEIIIKKITVLTVGELIEELKKFDKGQLVILQLDTDGNHYLPLRQCRFAKFSLQYYEVDDGNDTGDETLKTSVILSP